MSTTTYMVIDNDDGSIQWFHNGELHCTIGPAYIHPDGTEEYYINGEKISLAEFRLYSHTENIINYDI